MAINITSTPRTRLYMKLAANVRGTTIHEEFALRNIPANIQLKMPNIEWAQKMDFFYVISSIFAAGESHRFDFSRLGICVSQFILNMKSGMEIAEMREWNKLANGLMQMIGTAVPYDELLKLRERIDFNHKFPALIEEMIKTIKTKHGLDVPEVFETMRKFPRHWFAGSAEFGALTYMDNPCAIGFEQTMSQPYIVANMTRRLNLKGTEKVLDIGTGSGHQAAILSELCASVYSVDRIEDFVKRANHLFEFMEISDKVHAQVADGWNGLPQHAPYDRIIVAAGADEIPQKLKEQLTIGGELLIPVFTGVCDLAGTKIYMLYRVKRESESEFVRIQVPDSLCMFVPLVRSEKPKPERENEKAIPLRVQFNLPVAAEIDARLLAAQKSEFLHVLRILRDILIKNQHVAKEYPEIDPAINLEEMKDKLLEMIQILEKANKPTDEVNQLMIFGMVLSLLPDAVESLAGMVVKNLNMQGSENFQELHRSLKRIPRHFFFPHRAFRIISGQSEIKTVEIFAYKDEQCVFDGGLISCKPSQAVLSVLNLNLGGNEEVLEIGPDSGFLCAILADLLSSKNTNTGKVYSLKPDQYNVSGTLKIAREILGYSNIDCQAGQLKDKPFGEKRFDRIILSAPPDERGIPDYLLEHLKEGGIIVMPAKPFREDVDNIALIKVTKTSGEPKVEIIRENISE